MKDDAESMAIADAVFLFFVGLVALCQLLVYLWRPSRSLRFALQYAVLLCGGVAILAATADLQSLLSTVRFSSLKPRLQTQCDAVRDDATFFSHLYGDIDPSFS
jgi:hypothetical protein